METPIRLIVGLGNPGPQYSATRHNVGLWFAQTLVEQHNATWKTETKFKGKICQIKLDDHNCWLLFPSNYMNNSGEAVAAIANFYKIEPEEILVIHDELDFLPGTIRLKQNGGHGGHNGLRSIFTHLNSSQFYRLRIGIGHPGDKHMVSDYVLSKPSQAGHQQIMDAITKGLNIIPEIISGEMEKAIQLLHT